MRGFECSFSVTSIKSVIAVVVANGGTVAMSEFRIEGVGNGAFFLDTEGNRFAAMQYDAGIPWPIGSRAPD
jgi:predicted enzyme related to lactoylglutathione lyase